MYVCTYVRMYVCMYVCMCVYIYIYIYIYHAAAPVAPISVSHAFGHPYQILDKGGQANLS